MVTEALRDSYREYQSVGLLQLLDAGLPHWRLCPMLSDNMTKMHFSY